MTKLMSFIRHNLILSGLFLSAVLLALWFATHAISNALYFNDSRNVDVDLKPWMTPRFVVLTYDLPRPLVAEILELEPAKGRGIRLGRIANERGLTMEDLTKQVRDAAAAYREGQE